MQGRQSELLFILQQHNEIAGRKAKLRDLLTDALRDHIYQLQDWHAALTEDLAELWQRQDEISQLMRTTQETDQNDRLGINIEYLKRDLWPLGERSNLCLNIDIGGNSHSLLLSYSDSDYLLAISATTTILYQQ